MADRPRLIDVAQRAGVSIATASQAFTGHRPVSARTKAAVLKAAFDLGFVADSGARGCAVGMLIRPPEAIPGFGTGPDAFSTISGAVLISLLAAGYSVTSFRSLDDIGQQVGRLDAFVLLHPNRSDEVLRALVARGIPTVAYDQDPGDADFRWWVGPNYRRSMGALLAHVRERGARRPSLVIGSTENMYTTAMLAEYIEDARRVGSPVLVREVDPQSSRDGGRAAVASLLRLPERPDAVVTSSGVFAAGAVDAVRAAGLRCPEDVLIATMTDGVVAARSEPPITAMRHDTQTTARLVTELLQARLRNEVAPQRRGAELELIVRASTTLGR